MAKLLENSEPLSLWECLDDGSIESIKSEPMARMPTIVVDSSFHWNFHKLPPETRFRIVGENLRIAEVFEFEPWPGATESGHSMPWKEIQEQRPRDYEKGRLISANWTAFIAHLETGEDYEIMSAELSIDKPLCVLKLRVMSYPNSNYGEVKIHTERFHFNVGERELSLQEFQEFGVQFIGIISHKSPKRNLHGPSRHSRN